MTPASGVTANDVNAMKLNLVIKMMKAFDKKDSKTFSEEKCKDFLALAKLCSENNAVLKDDIKDSYMKLLQSVIKSVVSLSRAVLTRFLFRN